MNDKAEFYRYSLDDRCFRKDLRDFINKIKKKKSNIKTESVVFYLDMWYLIENILLFYCNCFHPYTTYIKVILTLKRYYGNIHTGRILGQVL